MLYVISGASRTGKTILAKELAAETGMSYFSLDWLVMGFSNGLSEYGIHHLLFPHEIAEKSWKFLKDMFESMIWGGEDYIIEGEAILPELIADFIDKNQDNIKVCFLGFTELDLEQKLKDVKEYSALKNDWLTKESDAYILDHIQNMVVHSEHMKKACEVHGIHYFDTSTNFREGIKRAKDYLLGK